MTVNEKLYGFIIDRIRPVDELEGQLIEMTHEKTGLQLAWIKRGEENKTFGIAFKTLPSNDTGVFHILEHSVLCGSEKYRVKEPFVELLKNSMNTFLNAMTFSDQTVFPEGQTADPPTSQALLLNLHDVLHLRNHRPLRQRRDLLCFFLLY